MTKEDFWKEFGQLLSENISCVNQENRYSVSWGFWWGFQIGTLYNKLNDVDRISVLLELSKTIDGDELLKLAEQVKE